MSTSDYNTHRPQTAHLQGSQAFVGLYWSRHRSCTTTKCTYMYVHQSLQVQVACVVYMSKSPAKRIVWGWMMHTYMWITTTPTTPPWSCPSHPLGHAHHTPLATPTTSSPLPVNQIFHLHLNRPHTPGLPHLPRTQSHRDRNTTEHTHKHAKHHSLPTCICTYIFTRSKHLQQQTVLTVTRAAMIPTVATVISWFLVPFAHCSHSHVMIVL